VITFGWMMIGGLIVSLIVTFLLFPAVLVLMPKEAPPGQKAGRVSLTAFLAGLTEAQGPLIVGFSALILLASLIGISKLQVENCFIDYFDEDTEIYQGMKVIDQRLGGTTPLDVVVEFAESQAPPSESAPAAADGDAVFDEFDEFDEAESDQKYWFTAEKMNRVKAVHGYLDSLPETGKVLSLATLMSIAEKLNGGKPLDSLELALLYSEAPERIKTLLIRPFVSVEHNQARFWVRVRDSEKTLRRNELLKRIRADLAGNLALDPGQVHLAGLLVLYNNMLQSLFGSQILTLGLTAALLTAMFLVLFRSLKIALVAMVPNVLPILLVLGVMGWLNIPLDMMTITIAAIGLGIAVDNTIHYIHRFRDEFRKDQKYVLSVEFHAQRVFRPADRIGDDGGASCRLDAAATNAYSDASVRQRGLRDPMTEERSQKTEDRPRISDLGFPTSDFRPRSCVLGLLFSVGLALLSAGCAVSPKAPSAAVNPVAATANNQPETPADSDFDLFEEELVDRFIEVADPLEPVNRVMFNVNDALYFWVVKPVAQTYKDLTPEETRMGIRNFFDNAGTPARYVNCLLQGKNEAADTELRRFVINTTAGVLGFGDPALDQHGLKPTEEDLGQTLAVCGLGDGFYIVWPFFGPSTARDSVGTLGDQFLNPLWYVNPFWYVEPTELSIGISAVRPRLWTLILRCANRIFSTATRRSESSPAGKAG
jgi:ABC-type transporter lipoprotein component MlaA